MHQAQLINVNINFLCEIGNQNFKRVFSRNNIFVSGEGDLKNSIKLLLSFLDMLFYTTIAPSGTRIT